MNTDKKGELLFFGLWKIAHFKNLLIVESQFTDRMPLPRNPS